METVFEDFFRTYEQYRVDLAAWDSRYGAGGNGAYGMGLAATTQPVVQLDAQYRQAGSGGGLAPTDPPAPRPVARPPSPTHKFLFLGPTTSPLDSPPPRAAAASAPSTGPRSPRRNAA